jgi:hypothetical protein
VRERREAGGRRGLREGLRRKVELSEERWQVRERDG